MDREVALGQGKSGLEDWLSDQEALVLAYSGQLQRAKKMSQHAADLAHQASELDREAGLGYRRRAMWDAFFGNRGRRQAGRDGGARAFQRAGIRSMALPLYWPRPEYNFRRSESRKIWKPLPGGYGS